MHYVDLFLANDLTEFTRVPSVEPLVREIVPDEWYRWRPRFVLSNGEAIVHRQRMGSRRAKTRTRHHHVMSPRS